MEFPSRPPTAYSPPPMLTVLTEEPTSESSQGPVGLSRQRSLLDPTPQGTTLPIYDNYSTRSSITFADNSNFSTPRGSRVNLLRPYQDHSLDNSRDVSRRTSLELNSSANSSYEPEKTLLQEPPYNVFSNKKQKALLLLASVAGVFSSLSSNIYFPALGIISKVSLLLLWLLSC